MSYRSMTLGRSLSASLGLSRIVSMLVVLMLCACSSAPLKDQPPPQAKEPPPTILPLPSPVKTEPVKWQVVEVKGEALFALTAKGYEALSRSTADVIRWAREASWQLNFYREQRQGIKASDAAPGAAPEDTNAGKAADGSTK